MSGADARRYAAAHLVVDERIDAFVYFSKGVSLEIVQPDRREWLDSLRGNAYGELVCPNTGWRFRESIRRDAAEYSLTRRPRTNRSDYLDAAIVRARAIAVEDTRRLIHVTVEKRHLGALELQEWVETDGQRAAFTTMATIVSDGSRRSGVKRRRRRSKRS